jgi:hypothetical protein
MDAGRSTLMCSLLGFARYIASSVSFFFSLLGWVMEATLLLDDILVTRMYFIYFFACMTHEFEQSRVEA